MARPITPRLTSKQRQQREDAAVRRPKVYALRVAGAPFMEIGRQLGISDGQACLDFHEYQAERRALHEQEAADARDLEDARLEMAMLPLAPRVRAGDLKAAAEWRKYCESRRQLWGTDAPVKVAQTDPTGQKEAQSDAYDTLSRRLARLSAALGAGGVDSEPDPTGG